MSDSSYSNSVPLLKGAEHYKEWARQARGFLVSVRAWRIVNGEETEPTDADEKKDWNKRAALAEGFFYMKCDGYVINSIGFDKKQAKEIWEALKTA